jgi:hypothetical protein
MAKFSPKVPAAIQARIFLLQERRRELNVLIDAMERYIRYLAVEPTSIESARKCPAADHARTRKARHAA